MTFRTDSDFYTPYGKIEATAKLPDNINEYVQVETFIQLRAKKTNTLLKKQCEIEVIYESKTYIIRGFWRGILG